jgi:arylsulfatase A-like enzyme
MKALVVVARGLRAAALSCYGSPWGPAPALDALAASGAVFEWHFADRPEPDAARRAWRSGCYAFPGATAFAAPDLIQALVAGGTHARLVLDASRPAPAFFAEGWSAVVEAGRGEESGLEATIEAALAALRELAGRDNWLLWVDLATTLPPWRVPEELLAAPEERPEDEEEGEEEEEEGPVEPLLDLPEGPLDALDDELYLGLQAGYQAAMTYLDAGMAELLAALDEMEGVAVLFTADHGLPLGERKAPGLYEEAVHLPLLLRLPGGGEGGLRVDALTQSVDLAPTLAELFGVAVPGAHGSSLLPLARERGGPVRPYACSGQQVGDAVEWSLRTPEWALLLRAAGEERLPQLFVKPDDRWEVNDVAQHAPDQVEALEKALRAFVAATAQPGPLQPPPLPAEGQAKG